MVRNQSRAFVAQVTPALGEGKLDEAISVAVRNKKSPIAGIVATGLAEFTAAPAHATSDESIDAAKRGLERSVATIHVGRYGRLATLRASPVSCRICIPVLARSTM